MKKKFFSLLGIFGFMVMFTTDVSASSVLSKISTIVLVFSILAGSGMWIYAMKKRRELDE